MLDRWLRVCTLLFLLVATAVLAQCGFQSGPTLAGGAGEWEYGELVSTHPRVWWQPPGEFHDVVSENRPLGPARAEWASLATKANVDLKNDVSDVGFLNAHCRDGWELCEFSTHSIHEANWLEKYWILRRPR